MIRRIAVLCSLFVAASGAAWADRGHAHFGISIAYPWGWPYPPSYYYPPYYAPAVVMQPPQVYVEQGAPSPAAAQEPAYWYYCGTSKAYYPYVKECSVEWQKVLPQPNKQ